MRIIDANLNRLREGIRVVEEHFRFFREDPGLSTRLKEIRHAVRNMEACFDRRGLLEGRDTENDPLASFTSSGELDRSGYGDVLTGNFKRAQEAARTIEEYSKIDHPRGSSAAKAIRFSLYACEKEVFLRLTPAAAKSRIAGRRRD